MTQLSMTDQTITFTSESEVRQAARDFARVMAESVEFQAFMATTEKLRTDAEAQHTIQAFQQKQRSLQTLQMLNAVSAEDQAELDQLQQAFFSNPTTTAYLQAQENLIAIFQASADLLSQSIGLSFSAACGPGCC
ncbi:MAG: YlbF family regulator [Anaerolineales bacterium]